ncbi:hypothetical protein XENOCAPTIV_011563 [Xenoophorus captivus]|uniref:Uncharacterized protein n=1 Tax=Xenoophorus captivus TaxID=1517983 RepID=A0ABV0SH31_9TELE
MWGFLLILDYFKTHEVGRLKNRKNNFKIHYSKDIFNIQAAEDLQQCANLFYTVTTATQFNLGSWFQQARIRKHCCGFLICELIVQTFTLLVHLRFQALLSVKL